MTAAAGAAAIIGWAHGAERTAASEVCVPVRGQHGGGRISGPPSDGGGSGEISEDREGRYRLQPWGANDGQGPVLSEARLISSVLEGADLFDTVQGRWMVFERASPACTRDGVRVEADEPIFERMALVARKWMRVLGEPSSETIVPLAWYGGYLWGGRPWSSTCSAPQWVYRSGDGITWEPVAPTLGGRVKSMYVSSFGDLFVATGCGSGSSVPGRVFRWNPDTESFDLVLTMLSSGAFAKHWSWTEANGILYVAEYGNKNLPDNARRLYRSLDGGATWELVYDPPPAESYHVHRIVADAARGHLYYSHGDEADFDKLMRSSDGGFTWESLSDVHQPTAGLARPEGVYFGADAVHVGIYRFPGGTDVPEWVCTRPVLGYVWDLRQIGSTLYAAVNDHELNNPPALLASADGTTWGVVYQWPIGTSGPERFVEALVGGRIYAVFESEVEKAAPLVFAAPVVRSGWGIRVDPPMVNLLATACDSSFEGCGGVPWQPSAGTQAEVSAQGSHSGAESLHVWREGSTGTLRVRSPVVPGDFPAGTWIAGSVEVNGWSNIDLVQLRIRDTTNGVTSINAVTRPVGSWRALSTTMALGRYSSGLQLEVYAYGVPAGEDLWIDSATISLGGGEPVYFHMGGQARAPARLWVNVDVPGEEWTDVFFWEYDNVELFPRADRGVIKAWSDRGDSRWLEVALTPSREFELARVVDGQREVLAVADGPLIVPGSLLGVAVACAREHTTLYVDTPAGRLEAVGPAAGFRPRRVWFGSTPAGGEHSGGLFGPARMYDRRLLGSEIAEALEAMVGP